MAPYCFTRGAEGGKMARRLSESAKSSGELWNWVMPMESEVKSGLNAKVLLGANGSILIPAAIRAEMGFVPCDTLLMEVEGGARELILLDLWHN
jgi:hypothetical protein